jgi:gallate decarboxylase subunit D
MSSNTEYKLKQGQGRTLVRLLAVDMGKDLAVRIFNAGAHIGAVAIGEYDPEHARSSVSVITRLGHKDDAIAQKAAYEISKNFQITVCVIAGVHIDNISKEEIEVILRNTSGIIQTFIGSYKKAQLKR